MEEKAADPYQYLYKFMIDTQELWRKAGPMLLLNKYRWVTSRHDDGLQPDTEGRAFSRSSHMRRR